MKLFKAIAVLIGRSIFFIGIPVGLIYLINANYPGLLGERYIQTLHLAMYLGIPIVMLYFLADITTEWKSMVSEISALVFVLLYTFLIMGYGTTMIKYAGVTITMYYPYLLYLIIAGVLVRIPLPVLRYLSHVEENENQ